jgi:hypothetical protein
MNLMIVILYPQFAYAQNNTANKQCKSILFQYNNNSNKNKRKGVTKHIFNGSSEIREPMSGN